MSIHENCDKYLIHGDCIKEMQKLIDDGVKVDLVVTSPPYDNLRSYNGSSEWNFDVFKKVANLLYEILDDGGVVVWVVGDATVNGSETGISFKQALYFMDVGFRLHDTMIYQKTGMAFPETTRYYPSFEYMFVLSKGKPKTINLLKKKNKTAGSPVYTTERQFDGTLKQSSGRLKKRKTKEYGVRFNIWTYSTGKGNSAKEDYVFKHPAIFPYDLAKDHILSWCNERDTVLDCFMGSGTTGVACLENNRNFIGIEIDEEYYNIAKKRCNEYQSKLM